MNTKLLSVAAVLSMVSGFAMAQTSECSKGSKEKTVECEGGVAVGGVQPGEHQVVMVTDDNGQIRVTVQPEVKVESHMTMIQKTNDHEYKVEIKGDNIKAWVDGDRVPKKRLKVTDEAIRILDDEGNTVAEFARMVGTHRGHFGGDVDSWIMLQGQHKGDDGPIFWDDDDEDHVWGNVRMFMGEPDFDHPPVMLGITMGEVDEDLAEDLDLDFDEGIVINSVIEGLPADEAGLREGDVIIEIEGESPVDAELLLEYLSESEPGDELEVVILRRGKERTVEIELEPYDAEALGVRRYGLEGDQDLMFNWREDGPETLDVEALRDRLQMLQRENPEAFEGDMEALMDLLPRMQRMQRGQSRELDVFPRIRTWRGDEGRDQRLLVQPSPRGQTMRGYDDRFDRMEERLERLEDRIDRLLEALEGREHDED
ncbi:hypothetical protein MNBD_PLANCTO03-1325 [hydrothermal vent metagenome]|uniref:PDZ domain-containing protein n=1 Tax=hydrothermal vent metagenome TaxID=652676 RepID=A0A3B1DK32_9ZZZZ